jgi:cephalosporin-C deacetylase
MQPGHVQARTTVDVVRPSDFEAYWADVIEATTAIPLDLQLQHVPGRSTEDVDVYDVHYTSLDGLRIAAWYCRPRQAAPPYPGLIITPGYISEPVIPKSWAKQGYATLALAPRGKLRSNATYNPGYPGLLVDNIVDRDTYSYRGFYMDAYRSVDVLAALPEVDAGRIGVYGSSQGGALAIVMAALRPDSITCAVSGAPYLCGFMAAARLTRSYPYEEINEYLRLHPEDETRVETAVSYYDGINFAPMIRGPMMLHVGAVDDVCPPETGLAVYDRLSCPKRLVVADGCAHDAGAHWLGDEIASFLGTHLGVLG